MMQEEMTQKTIALVFRATSFSARHFDAVLKEAKHDLERHDTAVQNRKMMLKQQKSQKSGGRAVPERKRSGRMQVAELTGQGEKLSTMQIPDDLKSFQRIAHRYNVDFAVKKDKSVDPPKYVIFFKAKDTEVLKECFKDYLNHQQRKQERPTFHQRLEVFREKAKQQHRTLEKKLNRGDRSL